MSEKQIVGYCPQCGCPIYQEIYWAGSGYPPAEYICKCYEVANFSYALPQCHWDGVTPAHVRLNKQV